MNRQPATNAAPNQAARAPVGAADQFPFPITAAWLARGETQFNISCSPCHGRTGYGDGMVVQRGFPRPPSYHTEQLRNAPNAHFYDVITNGFGRMWSYADQVEPRERWAITAYIRVLQLSQNATLAEVPAAQRSQLGAPERNANQPATPTEGGRR
jgi:mono/diheme cytochrome c family protein